VTDARQTYEYKTINLNARNKALYSVFTMRLTTRAAMATEKLARVGWELVNTTHNFMGYPIMLTFRKTKTQM